MDLLNRHPVVCFGEVLWDILPGGSVPGGAPVNVAYHLQKLGANPALVTRVGYDKEGMELVKVFADAGLCTDFFQIDYEYDTGRVIGRPGASHEMNYEIAVPSAWDHIDWDASYEQLILGSEYLVFGSLACRNNVSRETLDRLFGFSKCRVLDLNLRRPFYDRDIVEHLLDNCEVLKLNIAELELITGWFSGYRTVQERIKLIRDRFRIDMIVITMGGEGAWLNVGEEFLFHPGFPVEIADTVGAGDAFLAGMLKGMLDGLPHEKILDQASQMGAFVASRAGACPKYEREELFLTIH